ncbi:alpha-amylase family protein [Falsiroseomonas sp. E2-1-a20]|uniref:alpha-amylase family protein n=1 Tax=Falsiroseomonas sp. E2-1-a20 TaxID=3239300 RepID=UPI003F3B3319
MINLWYKNAVIYCLDVKTFMDSNGDGIGDFRGLADRLDHIESLGATCVWLLPFHPSPNRDNGYDITDYYGVDSRLGSLGDFVDFTHAARDRGLRIIVDLVVNHTSIDHPWFQEARQPGSARRDWYVWSEEEPADMHEGMVFPGQQESTWSWDDTAQAWYMHRFYKHQPDLNIANPEVREEIERIMGFWLQLGATGFRLDAVPFLIEYRGVEAPKDRPDPHHYLVEMRDFLDWREAESVLIAEANIEMSDLDEYFGDGDRLQMIINFVLNQQVFLALARGEAEPVMRIMRATPKIPLIAQWGSFLRNHDELDLGRLTDAERAEAFEAFAPEENMRIYGRGIRRRLAPMLGGDLRRIAMAHSLMFALPGTPVIWYGEELGMGEDLSLPERFPVRTPMQWSKEANAGFSRAAADELVRPVVTGGDFGFERLNVAAQRNRHASLLEHNRRLIATRRACPEIGWGACEVMETGVASVLALRSEWRGGVVVTLHNLAADPVEVSLPDDAGYLIQLLGSSELLERDAATRPIPLEGYGFRWFRLRGERR